MSSALVKEPKVVRRTIYTRKSTTEGLDSDFNTLDAQRDAAEHFIKSQAAQRWKVLPTRYDDAAADDGGRAVTEGSSSRSRAGAPGASSSGQEQRRRWEGLKREICTAT